MAFGITEVRPKSNTRKTDAIQLCSGKKKIKREKQKKHRYFLFQATLQCFEQGKSIFLIRSQQKNE